jgi:predicted ATP-dependent endonuclease of OLD family
MEIKLREFKIEYFRCIINSDWIELDDITALVGLNEAGKTAILKALHTLNPGSGNIDINHIRDFPRSLLSSEYNEEKVLIKGKYYISNDYLIAKGLKSKYKLTVDELILYFTRKYNKKGYYSFDYDFNPSYENLLEEIFNEIKKKVNRKEIEEIKINDSDEVEPEIVEKQENTPVFSRTVQENTLEIVKNAKKFLTEEIGEFDLKNKESRDDFSKKVNEINIELSKVLPVIPEISEELDSLEDTLNELEKPPKSEQFFADIEKDLPIFIYFEDYSVLNGNVNIADIVKAKKNNFKLPTMRIQNSLFKHVGLDPEEIYNLGKIKLNSQTFTTQGNQHVNKTNIQQIIDESAANIDKETEIKRQERKILTDSASQRMTDTLNKYFKEKNYRVEYEIDGQYLQVLISDSKKPSKINLEERSKGFRWYFSFFLIFLEESDQMHKNAILLLDEPGIHLHLQAQNNLLKFFEQIMGSNQIIYTTHSPFLIDEYNLERVRSVFEKEDGLTHITSDNLIPDRRSIFPLQAALSYSTSQVIYQGLNQLLVEGDTDYNYIRGIDFYLKKKEKTTLNNDIILIPCKSASKIEMYARLFVDFEKYPVILLDSDVAGKQAYDLLIERLYQKHPKKIIQISEFTEIESAEIEDFIGKELLLKIFNLNSMADSPISVADLDDIPFNEAIQSYCKKTGKLLKPDFKYSLSLHFKKLINEDISVIEKWISPEKLATFEKLINKINSKSELSVNLS